MNEFREIVLPPLVLMRCKQEALNTYTSNLPVDTVTAGLKNDLERAASLFDYLWGYEFGDDSGSDQDIIREHTGAELDAWQPFEDQDTSDLWDLILEQFECNVQFAKDIIKLHLEDC